MSKTTTSKATTAVALKWHGGKHYLAERVIALMPRHLHYVEPYFGSGQVLFARDVTDPRLWWQGGTSDGRAAAGVSEVINDIDGDLMNFYAVLRDEDLFGRLLRRLELTPFSEAEWLSAGGALAGEGGDAVERAAALFVSVRQSRQALRKDFVTPVRSRLRGGRQDHVNAWLGAIDGLADAHERLRGVLVLCRPAVQVVRSEDTPATLFYLDPPYLHETRSSLDAYRHEMTERDHRELLDTIRGCRGKVILSGYASPLYDGALSGWSRHQFELPNNAAGGAKKERKTEVLWCNF